MGRDSSASSGSAFAHWGDAKPSLNLQSGDDHRCGPTPVLLLHCCWHTSCPPLWEAASSQKPTFWLEAVPLPVKFGERLAQFYVVWEAILSSEGGLSIVRFGYRVWVSSSMFFSGGSVTSDPFQGIKLRGCQSPKPLWFFSSGYSWLMKKIEGWGPF